MTSVRLLRIRSLLGLASALLLNNCAPDDPQDSSDSPADGSESGDGDGDGDGDGPGDGDGDGPGDGDGDVEGEGDGDGDGDGDGEAEGDGDGDGDGPGDGDDDPVPNYPELEPCEPLELVKSDTVPVTYTYTYAVGDVDGQAGDEIVAYHQGEILSVSNGVPTTTPHPLPFGGVRDAVLLHADDDEYLDLIVSSRHDDTGFLRTFLGDGNGAFAYLGSRTFADALFFMAAAEAPERDALLVDAGYGIDQYLFVDPLANAPSSINDTGVAPTTGDVDGDGIDEFARGLLAGLEEVEILRREGDDYVVGAVLDCQIDGANQVVHAVIQDVDADGLDDVVCIAERKGPENIVLLRLYSSLGGFEFEQQPTVAVTGMFHGGGHNTHIVADLQGDGAPEFIIEHHILVRIGDDGNFGCQQTLVYPFDTNEPLRAGDVDNDGREELVIADSINDDALMVYGVP